MIVISDASPIIYLSILGKLELLPKLYGKIILPEAVFYEITVRGAGMPGADVIENADWVEVKKCSNQSLVLALRNQIDPGEAEAIALSVEINADVLLIDERLGRRIAKDFQVPILGLLGFLRDAKSKGHLKKMKPLLNKLISSGFRISTNLYEEVLRSVNE